VGRAYLSLGEFERAQQVFLAVAQASFMKEIRVGGTLEDQGEHLEAAAYALKLYYSYPALPVVRQAFLAVGQELARKAEGLAPGQLLGTGGPGKTKLLSQALGVLREFLVLHPEDRQAPEATFAVASGWLGLKKWEQALGWAKAGVKRYQKSRWADELLYLEGYSRFALGQYDQAQKALARVAEDKFPNSKGQLVASDSRWLALFLVGQIHHALGDRTEAEKYYGQVKDRFADAAQNLSFIQARHLVVPDVTLLQPEDKTELELTWRNIKEASVRIYRVDLLRLYVLQKSLSGIRGIQLAGIKPFKEVKITLGEHGFLTQGKKKVTLPVEKAGAYLLMVQSSDMVTTGLVLKTALKLKVQENDETGRVSVHVFKAGKPVPGAYVKVAGSGDKRFRSGETDFRGIYAADQVMGKATVLVKAGEAYAFHRGEKVLLAKHFRDQGRRYINKERKQQQPTNVLQTLEKSNLFLQKNARKQLDELFDNDQKGVQIKGMK